MGRAGTALSDICATCADTIPKLHSKYLSRFIDIEEVNPVVFYAAINSHSDLRRIYWRTVCHPPKDALAGEMTDNGHEDHQAQ